MNITASQLIDQCRRLGRPVPAGVVASATTSSGRPLHPADAQPRGGPITPTSLTIVIPLATRSESNTGGKFKARLRRKAFQRGQVERLLTGNPLLPPLPVRVNLVRIAPGRGMDPWDNLQTSMKPIRDAIARAYHREDADGSFIWPPATQLKGPYAVRIELTTIPQTRPATPPKPPQD